MIWDLIQSGKLKLKDALNILKKESANYTSHFESLEGKSADPTFVKAYRNKHFLVQVFKEQFAIRLSINKAEINKTGTRWQDGITWDEIQNIKNKMGYGNSCAVEIYPPEKEKVDVANIRHIFILKEAPPFMWKRKA